MRDRQTDRQRQRDRDREREEGIFHRYVQQVMNKWVYGNSEI